MMGCYVPHFLIVFSMFYSGGGDKARSPLKLCRQKAEELFGPGRVTDISRTACNFAAWFVVGPSGASLGVVLDNDEPLVAMFKEYVKSEGIWQNVDTYQVVIGEDGENVYNLALDKEE